MKVWRIVLAVALATMAGTLLWRWASNRASIPCPSWLSWMLTSEWLDRLIGTQATVDRLGLKPGMRVLEIGPGPGRLLIPAAKRVLPGGEVVGLDIQPKMLDKLRARAEAEGIRNLTALEGNAEEEHFAPESFDLVYMATVLGEIPDRAAALRQCYRVLKPGGVLAITEVFPDPHFQVRSAVERLARDAGFRPLGVEGPWYFYTARFAR